MVLRVIVLWLLAVRAKCQLSENLKEVQLLQGKIIGVKEDAGNGRFYYAFKSIPYAQPPIGDLRFHEPVPSSQWTGQRNGSQTAPDCPQINIFALLLQGIFETVGQEDCLYLNVYTPRPFASDLPVMVYIHGGSFLLGSVADVSPLPLLTEDVVLVTFHYRVGTLGFLSTEDSVMPGNLGLKDQTMAIRWVHDNIHDLGGDPNRVTIFGASAGAASVHFQVLSPYASGLFKRVILQSGSALGPLATRSGHRQVAATIGQMFNCSGVGSSAQDLKSNALLQCLRTVPVENLVPLPFAFTVWNLDPLVMVPRIDGDFIPDDPAILLKQKRYNKVDMITGIAAHDGAITTNSIYSNDALRNSLVQNFSVVGPIVMDFQDDENPEDLARKVFIHYLGEIKITEENADTVTQIFTDRLFSIAHDHTAQLHARDFLSCKKVYMYELHHRGQYTRFPPAPNTHVADDWVGHGDEVQYIFDSASGYQPLERPADLALRRIIVKLWTNFAKTGNPTPDESLGFRWLPVKCLRHLRLKEVSTMHNDNRTKIRNFWNELPTKQNRILFPGRFGFYPPS